MSKMNWIDQSGPIPKKELDKNKAIQKSIDVNKIKKEKQNENKNK